MFTTRGLYLALTSDELRALRAVKGDPARRAHVAALEERWSREWTCETDKAWRYLQAMFQVVRGPRLHDPDLFFHRRLHKARMYQINLLDLPALRALREPLARLDRAALKLRYDAARAAPWNRHLFPGPTADRFDYVAHWFERIREFLPRAEAAGRPVVFTAWS